MTSAWRVYGSASRRDISARISPAIKSLEVLDPWDIFRQVVDIADFESGDKRLGAVEVDGHHVRWKVVGSVIAIGLADEFSTPRKTDDA